MILDVLLTNRENVLSGLRDLRTQLGLLEAALQAGDEAGLRTLIQAGAQQRSRLVTEKAP
jgi:prephenate dehydrogenase